MEEALGELLRLSLRAWGIAGEVRRGGDGLTIIAGARRIAVRRAPAPQPFRWLVHGEKARGAMSVAGVLKSVRALLDPGHRPAGLLVGSLPSPPQPRP
jgi:hypothetical protein